MVKFLFICSFLGAIFQSVGQSASGESTAGESGLVESTAEGNITAGSGVAESTRGEGTSDTVAEGTVVKSTTVENPVFDVFVLPMVKTYAEEVKNCSVSDLNINSLSSLKGVCQGLVDSGFCSKVEEEYQVDCNKLIFNKDRPSKIPDYIKEFKGDAFYSWQVDYKMKEPQGFIPSVINTGYLTKQCGLGVVQGFVDIYDVLKTSGGLAVATMTLFHLSTQWTNESVSYVSSGWNNLTAEADRLEIDEGSGLPFTSAVASAVNEGFTNFLAMDKEFGCLNEGGQTKVICQFVTDVAAVASGTAGVTVLTKKGLQKLASKAMDVVKKRRAKNIADGTPSFQEMQERAREGARRATQQGNISSQRPAPTPSQKPPSANPNAVRASDHPMIQTTRSDGISNFQKLHGKTPTPSQRPSLQEMQERAREGARRAAQQGDISSQRPTPTPSQKLPNSNAVRASDHPMIQTTRSDGTSNFQKLKRPTRTQTPEQSSKQRANEVQRNGNGTNQPEGHQPIPTYFERKVDLLKEIIEIEKSITETTDLKKLAELRHNLDIRTRRLNHMISTQSITKDGIPRRLLQKKHR